MKSEVFCGVLNTKGQGAVRRRDACQGGGAVAELFSTVGVTFACARFQYSRIVVAVIYS